MKYYQERSPSVHLHNHTHTDVHILPHTPLRHRKKLSLVFLTPLSCPSLPTRLFPHGKTRLGTDARVILHPSSQSLLL